MLDEMCRLGHLLQLLYCTEHFAQMRGDMLLLQVLTDWLLTGWFT